MQPLLERSISTVHHVNSYNLAKVSKVFTLAKNRFKTAHYQQSVWRLQGQMLWLARYTLRWLCKRDNSRKYTIPALPIMLCADVVLSHFQASFYDIMTSNTPRPVFQELLAMWKWTNADFKQMHPCLKDLRSPANIGVKEVKETVTPLRNRSTILPVWDIWCSPLGCADTPVSGQQGGNFCPAESGNSYKSPASIKRYKKYSQMCEHTVCMKKKKPKNPFPVQNASGHLPHRGSAERSCRGCFQHIWVPCREYAGCSGVCGQSHPPDVHPPVCVLPDKNCNETFVSKIVKTSRNFRSDLSIHTVISLLIKKTVLRWHTIWIQ